MLETLLERMKRRKGLRGICCSNQLPKKRNWRFRYFEGGHPLPNEDSFAAARAALAMLRKARKDTLVFFLISGGGSAMFDLPLDPHITLEDTIAFHQLLLARARPSTRSIPCASIFPRSRAVAWPWPRRSAKVSLLLPDVPLRSLDALSSGPTSPDHSTVAEVRELLAKYDLAPKLPPSIRAFFEREDLPESPGNKGWRPPFFPSCPGPGPHSAAASPRPPA
jgi:glycerate 2-kinase